MNGRLAARLVAVLALALSTFFQPAAAQQAPLTITFVGQSMIRGDIRLDSPEAIPAIKSLVKGDAAFTNFEAAVFEPRKGESYKSGRFASPAAAMEALKSLGFNLLSLSNNHAFDIKDSGIDNTVDTAARLQLVAAGTGPNVEQASRPAYLKTPRGTIALIALASGSIGDGRATPTRLGVNELRVENNKPNAEDAQRILAQVREAKRNADIVVVSQHNHRYPGVERPDDFKQVLLSQLPLRLEPAAWLRPWVRELMDAGADVFAGHGPPFMHGVEIYKGKPIFYSLGNFIFQVPPESIHLEEPITWESVVAYVDFRGGKVTGVSFQPIAMNKVGKGIPNPHDQFDVNQYHRTRGLPRAVTGPQARYLLERLVAFSKPYGTRIEIKGEMAQISLGGAGRSR